MTNRWIRFLLAVLAIAAASAAAYRVVQIEQRLARETVAARSAAFSADIALTAVEELKATLHAYVAPGQGADFWTLRARLLLDRLRSALLELDAPATAAGASVAEALDACDRLAAAEQRAQAHVRDQQALLAGEVIFTEARDLLDATRLQIVRSRDRIGASASQRQVELRREQMYLLAGGAGVLALVMSLLVPTRQSVPVQTPESSREAAAPIDFAPPASAGTPVTPPLDTDALADICGDLAAVTESDQIRPLLERTCALLEARGVILWVIAPDRARLQAAVASGYDDRVVARIGSIARTDSNLTADAFRDNRVRTSVEGKNTPAAIAVPLPAPGGPAGVFSAELTPGAAMDNAKLNAARVIAAQLGAVIGTATAKLPDGAGGAPSAGAVRSSS